jgi:hypothetical protein
MNYQLARQMHEAYGRNQNVLDRLTNLYSASVIVLVFEVILLVLGPERTLTVNEEEEVEAEASASGARGLKRCCPAWRCLCASKESRHQNQRSTESQGVARGVEDEGRTPTTG